MSNKFFDIIPPGEEIETAEEKQVSYKDQPEKKEKKSSGRKIKRVVIGIGFLLLLAGAGMFFFRSAEVRIYPQVTNLELEENITIVPSKEQTDFVAKSIPGEIVEVEQSMAKDFSATGKTSEEKRARGTIRVYNAYSTSPQILVASTRFVSADGKLFRSVQRETISGGRYEEGEFVPGYADIEVKAAEPGEEYNIEATTFSIPGFSGTDRYTDFYGKSFQAMEGGYIGEMSQVTQEDLARAREQAIDQAKRESRDLLGERVSQEFDIAEETIVQEILSEAASAQAGDVAETFNYQVEVKTTGLSFKKSYLQDFADNLLNLSLPEKKKIKEGTREFSYSVIEAKDSGADLKIKVQAKAYYDLDLTALKGFLAGQSRQEAEIMLNNQPGIERAEIDLGGFWNRKFPKKPEEIKIELLF